MEVWLITLITATGATGIFGSIGYGIWNHYRQQKMINQKVPDTVVIEIARENYGKINAALLCEQTGITAPEAKKKLEYLVQNNVLATDWTKIFSGGNGYILPNTTEENIFTKFFKTKGSFATKVEALFNNDTKQTPVKSLSQNKDAQIITLAIENQGVVSASMVCVKLNISIDEAQKKLEELRQKQIFINEVGQNGGMLYRLLDV